MYTRSRINTFATKITIQQVEVILAPKDLHLLLGGQSMSVLHQDKSSPAEFHIILTPTVLEEQDTD